MLELQTAVFAALIPDPCDQCKGLQCALPFGIDSKGFSSLHADTAPNIVARWPACPRKWDALYQCGMDVAPLNIVVQWTWETGAHKHPLFPAGGARLVREWLRIRDLPGKLLEIRRYEESKRGKL